MLYAKLYKNATTTYNVPVINMGDLSDDHDYTTGNVMYPPANNFSFRCNEDNNPYSAPTSGDLATLLTMTGALYSSPHLTSGIYTFVEGLGNRVTVSDDSAYTFNYVNVSPFGLYVTNIYLATATINGTQYLGFCALSGFDYRIRTLNTNCYIFMYDNGILRAMFHDLTLVDEIGNVASIDGIGGTDGDYDFTGDVIDLPSSPDESVSGALAHGFLNIYSPSASQLRAFGGLLWTNAFNVKWYDYDSVSQLLLNAISDPINFIVGLFMLPITPTTSVSTGIFLGGINANTVTAPRVSAQFKTIDFGTISISELYGNYLDYSNSRISIYLPYIGTADIDVQEVNGGSISLQYIIDCFTGACVANVKCEKSTQTPWGDTYTNSTVHSYSGNVSIQLPISAGSFDTMMQGLINVGLGLGTNTPAVMMSGSKDIIQGFSGDVTTRGSLSSNTGKLCYQTPYLMFTRPIESRPVKLGNLHGYSAGVGGKLSNFSGYVECSDVKITGINATSDELTMIESLLKGGVYV